MKTNSVNFLKKIYCFIACFALLAVLIPLFSVQASAADKGFPAAFDLRSVDTDGDGEADSCWVTHVKSQDPFGTCWGFAAIKSAETSILSSGLAAQDGYAAKADPEKGLKELDLSEKHVAYFALSPVDDPDNPQYGEGMVFTGNKDSNDRYNTGGMSFYATGLFASGTGPVHEDLTEQFEYHGKNRNITEIDGTPSYYSEDDDWSIDDSLRFYQSYVLKESYILNIPSGFEGKEREDALNAFKDVLYSGHAIEIGLTADVSTPGQDPQTAYISENWAHYTYENAAANHEVTIIGWDDNYPKENFAHKTLSGEDAPLPEHDGAWLAMNSWGAEDEEFPDHCKWGLLQGQDKGVYNETSGKYEYNAIEGAVHTGCFWISYDDKSLDIAEALEFDSAAAEEGYFIAEHDYMPVENVYTFNSGTEASMANVFCVGDDVDAVRIEMVSCQTFVYDTDVHVDVYVLDDDWEDPADGRLVSQADASFKYGGFHKIMLDNSAVILRDQYFSVVITQKDAESNYHINIQTEINKDFAEKEGYPFYAVGIINRGESFVHTGGKWDDLSLNTGYYLDICKGEDAKYYDIDNFPIKAYLALPSGDEIPEKAADYKDIGKDAWYYDSAVWAVDNDIAAGTSPDTFSPAAECSRAQAVTWLWRAAGMPEPAVKESPFTDIGKGDYCFKAALWAYENGIVRGSAAGMFLPRKAVTRAQLTAMLYRYEKMRDGGFTGAWAFPLNYSDATSVPDYAYEPFCWMTMNKIIYGRDGKLLPNDSCSRAQTVSVLNRYFK